MSQTKNREENLKNSWTTRQAAEEVGVTETRIKQLANAGLIDHSYFGRALVISALGIKQAKERNTKPGPARRNSQNAA